MVVSVRKQDERGGRGRKWVKIQTTGEVSYFKFQRALKEKKSFL